MALRSFCLATAAGFGCSLYRTATSEPALCDQRQVSKNKLATPTTLPGANETCRCVIIGGGFAGAKAAYYLDSLFDVTLIDEKNFFELGYGAIPLITSPWVDMADDPNNSVAEFKKISSVHRFYLKRANVLTGTANNVTETEVTLSDGRKVPYDLLIIATGGRKSFPFHTTQRTLAGRIDELKQFNELLHHDSCRKIGIIGGGPAGVSLAASLLEQQPDKEVVLFHSHGDLVPHMPKSVRKAIRESLEGMKASTTFRRQVFSKYTGKPATDQDETKALSTSNKEGSLTLRLNTRVTDVKAIPSSAKTIDVQPPSNSNDESEQPGGLLSFFRKPRISAPIAYKNLPTKYNIIADELDPEGGDSADLKQKLAESRSLLHRVYFGDFIPEKSIYGSLDNTSDKPIITNNGGYEEDFNTKIRCIKRESVTFEDFDYVFDMRGTVPRPIIKQATKNDEEKSILNAHILPDGKYRTSLLLQLMGRPNVFAIGKCNNLPWQNSAGMSDTQVKTLFSEMLSVLFADPTNPKLLTATDGLQPSRMMLPKMIIPLGSYEAAGYSTQKGAVKGAAAYAELKADREHLVRNFIQPLFFKQRNQQEAKNRILCWLNEEITDVTGFTF